MRLSLKLSKAAEALAVQAQQVTANLRHDRGLVSPAVPQKVVVSFVVVPIFRKIVLTMVTHLGEKVVANAYLAGKSKGFKGSKGKSKDGMMSAISMDPYEQFAMSKGKGKMKGKFKPSVGVYGMDFNYDMYPMEMMESSKSSTTNRAQPVVPVGYGMLDCGATASAGPEAVAKKLISHLRTFDENLNVELNYDRRPFFRYGSGKWGQASYHAVVTPSLAPHRSFEMYVLENPPEYYEPWYTDDMLVPILVGMDHLRKTGLIFDFSDGHAVHGKDPHPVPYTMNQNYKGHYMVNIVHYMFDQAPAQAAMLQHYGAEVFHEDPWGSG